MVRSWLGAAAALLLLDGCASVDYDRLGRGRFTGSVIVIWLGEGGSAGDGRFLFVPDPDEPLTFHRPDPRSPGATVKPGLMYTDGGSIPRVAQVFRGLSPWGYAPAYMIHDWLFVARRCLLDGVADRRYAELKDVTFDESAAILGEAIKTLVATGRVRPDDVAAEAITTAVGSPIARGHWDERGACDGSQVTAADRDEANRAVPGSSAAARSRAFGPLSTAPAHRSGRPARVVARIAF